MDSNRERTSTLSDGAATVHDASTNIAATVDAYATLARAAGATSARVAANAGLLSR